MQSCSSRGLLKYRVVQPPFPEAFSPGLRRAESAQRSCGQHELLAREVPLRLRGLALPLHEGGRFQRRAALHCPPRAGTRTSGMMLYAEYKGRETEMVLTTERKGSDRILGSMAKFEENFPCSSNLPKSRAARA